MYCINVTYKETPQKIKRTYKREIYTNRAKKGERERIHQKKKKRAKIKVIIEQKLNGFEVNFV